METLHVAVYVDAARDRTVKSMCLTACKLCLIKVDLNEFRNTVEGLMGTMTRGGTIGKYVGPAKGVVLCGTPAVSRWDGGG